MAERTEVLGFKPQRETSYGKFLPYAHLVDAESNVQLADIKAHLAKTVQLRDLKIGATHWTGQLQKYIRLYGRKFSKEDHVLFIKLLFEVLVQPDQELSLVHKFSNLLVTLLKKTELLTRDDLVLPWRPLYDLLEATVYSPYEPHGLQLLPVNIDSSLKSLVRVCRPYFSVESTQEMLDEWRPLLCPFDVTMLKAVLYFELFLPTLLPPEHHDKGFKLWLDDFLGVWDTCHNTPQWEGHLLSLFARVADNNKGYIDWEPWIPKVFTRILRNLNLPVGAHKMQVTRPSSTFDVGTISYWISVMLGGGGVIMDHLTMFFKATENFYHPSNFGKWTTRLPKFVGRMTASVMKRIHTERYKPTWHTATPDDQKLTDDDITAFVKCTKDVVLLSMFSKIGSHDAALAYQHLAAMRPEIMIPPLLERVYPAMETLIEPHRLISCMNCVVASSRPLLNKTKYFSEGRSHVIPLLCLSLPGIDTNDVKKCLTTFQLISTFVSLVPIADCSDAIHIRSDLTDDERELCSATAQWEDFVLQFIDRVITLINNYAQDNHTHAAHASQTEQSLTPEEHIIEIGLLSTFNSMLQQCSTPIYKSALKKLFTFVTTSIYEIRVAGRFAGDLVRAACKANPELCLKKFLPHFCRVISAHITAEEIAKEEKVDAELLWNLTLLSEVIRCDGSYLLPYKDQLMEVLDFVLSLHAKEGYTAAAGMLEHMLKVLTQIYVTEYRSVTGGWDRPLEENLPIRDWGKAGNFNDLNVQWHVPSAAEKEWATELLRKFLLPELEKLKKFTGGEAMAREEVLQSLTKIDHCILGAAAALPWWQGEPVPLVVSQIPMKRHRQTAALDDGIDLNGENVREMVARVLRTVAEYMLNTCEDDTKSLTKLIKVYHGLLFYTGVRKDDLDGRWKSFKVVKKAMENLLLGKKYHIRALMIDRVQLQHELRVLNRYEKVFTQLHKDMFEDLFKLSISRYSEVRKKAQATLSSGFFLLAYSYKALLPEIVKYLRNDPEVEHHQFKGALFVILGTSKRCLAAKRNWDVLELLWPALVQAQHSEKPSILRLIDGIADKIHKDVESPAISVKVSESCIEASKAFWYDGAAPAPSISSATVDEMEAAKIEEIVRRDKAIATYNNLCKTLVGLVDNGNLLWKFCHMNIELLTLMLRHDVELPLEMVNMFTKNIINETLNIRKICIGATVGILKSQKRAAKRLMVDPYEVGKVAAPTEMHPGDRPDSTWHHYREDFPLTNESWETTVFVEKTHYGYWTWPKKLCVYAPPSQQPPLDRSRDQLNEGERVIFDSFSDPAFVEKLIAFLSMEDQKGKDKFSSKNYMLFKGLFRNFGDTFLPILKPHIEKLANDTKHDTHDSSHRCAAEIIAGLIRGCKHWPLSKVEAMWSWLVPIIKQVLNKMTVESIAEWGTCFATASESRDPRKLKPMFDLLMETPLNSEGGSFNNASRLYVLQGALAQQEWRVPQLLFKLLDYLMPFLTHSYKNVRDRLGSVLTNVFICDYMVPFGSPTTSPQRPPFIEKLLPLLEILVDTTPNGEKSNEEGVSRPDEASGSVSPASPMETDSRQETSLTSMEVDDDNGEDSERKTSIRLAKTVMKWLNNSYGRMLYSSPPEIFQFLPLLCQVESDTTDDELRHDALFSLGCMAQALVKPENIPALQEAITKISNMASWHARANVLSFLQVHVFCNFFVLQDPELKEKIQNIVVHLLCDDQLEVRENAAVTLGGLLHCGYLEMNATLLSHFEKLSGTKLKKKKRKFTEPLTLELLIKRHAGVLGLSACVQAYPYDVPEFIPQILMDLSDHLDDPQPIQGTVKKTLSNFRRTHHDNWQDHKQKFTDDQLVVLTDVLVSPNYYA